MSIKIKKFCCVHKSILKFILYLLCLPFVLVFMNYLINAIFNLGVYAGTFIRCLYNIVVY